MAGNEDNNPNLKKTDLIFSFGRKNNRILTQIENQSKVLEDFGLYERYHQIRGKSNPRSNQHLKSKLFDEFTELVYSQYDVYQSDQGVLEPIHENDFRDKISDCVRNRAYYIKASKPRSESNILEAIKRKRYPQSRAENVKRQRTEEGEQGQGLI